MKKLSTYVIQLGGLAAAAIGLVLTFKTPAITALLIFGGLGWYAGGYLRQKGLL